MARAQLHCSVHATHGNLRRPGRAPPRAPGSGSSHPGQRPPPAEGEHRAPSHGSRSRMLCILPLGLGGDGKPLSLLSLLTASTYSSALLPLSFWGAWCGQCLEGKARGLKMPGFVLITGDEAQGRRNGHRGLGQGLSLEIPRNRCSRQGHPGGTRVSHLGRGEGCCGQKGRNRLRWLGMPRICWFGECQWCLGALLRCLALGRIRAHGQWSRA